MAIENDVEDLKEFMSESIKMLLETRIQLSALISVLIEHHDLSPAVLAKYQSLAEQRAEKLRDLLEPATHRTMLERLKRFQGPPQ